MATVEMKTLKFENDANTYAVVDENAVHYTPQTLSDVQKTQVLNNIGASAIGHKHALSDLGAAATIHTHHTTEINYNISDITSATSTNDLPTGVSIFAVNSGTSNDFPVDYAAMVTFKNSNDRGFSIIGGKGRDQQVYFRGLQSSENKEWNKIYTGSDIKYSTTQPTSNLTKGQLWLKPV